MAHDMPTEERQYEILEKYELQLCQKNVRRLRRYFWIGLALLFISGCLCVLAALPEFPR